MACREQLVQSGQITPELRRSEAGGLIETANSLLAIGDTTGALAAATQARQINADLVAQSPGNTDWRHQLSIADERVGNVQVAQGDLTAALQSYRHSVAVRQRLAQSEPGNDFWQREFAVAQGKIGDVQAKQGDLAGALKSFRDALPIVEQLPSLLQTMRSVSTTSRPSPPGLATFRDQGDLAGALKSYRDGQAVDQRLMEAHPDNSQWLSDTAIGDDKVGDVQKAQGDLVGALQSYRASLAIRQKLTKSDPGNGDWQSKLSASYERVGDAQFAQGDLTAACNPSAMLSPFPIGWRSPIPPTTAGNMIWRCFTNASLTGRRCKATLRRAQIISRRPRYQAALGES